MLQGTGLMAVPTYQFVVSRFIDPGLAENLHTVRLGAPQNERAFVLVPRRGTNDLRNDIAGYPYVEIRDLSLQFFPVVQGVAYFDRGYLFVPPDDFSNSFYTIGAKTAEWLRPVRWDVYVLTVP